MRRRGFLTAGGAALAWPAAGLGAARRLNAHRLDAARRPARFLIVMLHGFGSDGADMFGLARAFQGFAPGAAVVAPDAPFAVGPGYSWTDPALRGRGDAAERAARDAAGGGPVLEAFVGGELDRYRTPPERLILIGFSQGASVALNAGLRRPVAPAAIIAYSGANLSPDGLTAGGRKPPVLLVQGDRDDRVPDGAQAAALRTLAAIGAEASGHILPGLGHGIDERGVALAGALIRRVTA